MGSPEALSPELLQMRTMIDAMGLRPVLVALLENEAARPQLEALVAGIPGAPSVEQVKALLADD